MKQHFIEIRLKYSGIKGRDRTVKSHGEELGLIPLDLEPKTQIEVFEKYTAKREEFIAKAQEITKKVKQLSRATITATPVEIDFERGYEMKSMRIFDPRTVAEAL